MSSEMASLAREFQIGPEPGHVVPDPAPHLSPDQVAGLLKPLLQAEGSALCWRGKWTIRPDGKIRYFLEAF